jgi:hypothetical protein
MAVRRLDSQDDIRRALAHVYREVEADRMPVQKGRALIYAALAISQVITETDLEARIAALEAQHNLARPA